MPTNFIPTATDYVRFLPEIILTIVATLIMFAQPILKERGEGLWSKLSLASLAGALFAAIYAYTSGPGTAFQGLLIIDGFATFFRILVILVGVLCVFSSTQYLRKEHAESAEYNSLVLYSIVGQCILVTANELMMVFIGLEISSIATYILAGYLRDDKRNNESAIKYFLLGSFATAFLLYGIAWIYGLTGTTDLLKIREALTGNAVPNLTLVGTSAALMLVGFAFKISAAPFQIWAPDVYQGAPAPVSAFMSAGPKAAAFAVFVRVFMTAFEPVAGRWVPILWVIALCSMIVGNFAAILQSNIKRLLAYSSIAHAGYVLVAVTTHSDTGTAAVMFYLAAYAFMNIGAFALVTHLARKGERYLQIDDMAGLGFRQPVTAALFTVFLLSLIGVPLTGGFFGKFYVFKAALDAKLVWLTILGLLNSAVAAYYYLRIIVVMYMHDPCEATENLPPLGAGIGAAAWLSAIATLILGIFPSAVLDFAGKSATLVK